MASTGAAPATRARVPCPWATPSTERGRAIAAASTRSSPPPGFATAARPDGRVLRLCGGATPVTISEIGRELGITRQGASKIVAGLRDRGYVTLSPSPTDGREKIVTLTAHARAYLRARHAAAKRIEARLRRELGDQAFDGLHGLLEALAGQDRVGFAEELLREPAGLWE